MIGMLNAVHSRRSTRVFSAAAFAIVMLAGAACEMAESVPREAGADSDAISQVAGGAAAASVRSNGFATRLHRALSRTERGNLFTSPWSLRVALAMTYAGAAGETATQMAGALHFSGVDPRDLHQEFSRSLREWTASNADYQMSMANRLWAQRDFELLPEFVTLTDHYYGAPISRVDFRAPAEVRREINAWTAEQTAGAVRKLIPDGILSDRTRLVLSNAIHFKGAWLSEFPREATRDAPFRVSATETAMVPMMHRLGQFEHARDADVQILKLPYVGGAVSMLIILPLETDGLRALGQTLDVARYGELTARLTPAVVDVHLPRFRLESTLRLDEALQSMGMALAFDRNRADFSAITGRRDLYVSAVLQKAVVEVDEQGTEAAAGSAAVLNTRSLVMPVEFRADRPFLFVIAENATGTILFIGRVSNPASAGER